MEIGDTNGTFVKKLLGGLNEAMNLKCLPQYLMHGKYSVMFTTITTTTTITTYNFFFLLLILLSLSVLCLLHYAEKLHSVLIKTQTLEPDRLLTLTQYATD